MKLQKPNGTVEVSERLTVKLTCAMNFKWFPFDSQVCPIYIEAYGNREHQMKLDWREDNPFEEGHLLL